MRLRQPAQVDIRREPVGLVGEIVLPKAQPLLGIGHLEQRHRLEAAGEGFVELRAQIGGEDHDAGKILDPLQQIGHLLIGGAVVGVAGLGALAEQRIRLVEEQDPVAVLSVIEQAGEVFLGLADIFRHHLRQIDAIDRQPRQPAEQRRGHRLAGAGRPVEHAAIARLQPLVQLPAAHQPVVMADPGDDVLQVQPGRLVDHQILPVERRGDQLRRKFGTVRRTIGSSRAEALDIFRRQPQGR